MTCSRYGHDRSSTGRPGLARMTAAARLGTKAARMAQRAIASALGVTEGAVSQWVRRGREDGVASLRHRPPPGPTPRLTPEQLGRLPLLLGTGRRGVRLSRSSLDGATGD